MELSGSSGQGGRLGQSKVDCEVKKRSRLAVCAPSGLWKVKIRSRLAACGSRRF